jgi:hypothetical protein
MDANAFGGQNRLIILHRFLFTITGKDGCRIKPGMTCAVKTGSPE